MPEPIGILGVLQTPFSEGGQVDFDSHAALIEDALGAGIDGFLVPAIASENWLLTSEEKMALASQAQKLAGGRAPLVWGTGSNDPEVCIAIARQAERLGAAACLIAVPPERYHDRVAILEYFSHIAAHTSLPFMIQDWQPSGSGLTMDIIIELRERIPNFKFIKIETIPAGPKYTETLLATGGELHVSGGWAVQQMIEALDRGVHAMIPECSMAGIYKQIDTMHRGGNRQAALELFQRLQPVLCFTNQQLDVSIRFFKRLLVRKGIFKTSRVRLTSSDFDAWSERIAEELIEHVLGIESNLRQEASAKGLQE